MRALTPAAWLGAWALAIGSASASASASALPSSDQPPPAAVAPVALLVESCREVDEQALRQLLRLEIGDQLAPATTDEGAPGDKLVVRCHDGEARLIAAAGSSRGPAVERTVRLSDFPDDASARVLALAGVELLASLDRAAPAPAAPATIVASTAEPAAPAPTVKSARAAPAPALLPAGDTASPWRSMMSRTRFGVAVVRRAFLADAGVTAWGASASAHAQLSPDWAARVDLEGAVARSGDTYASARTYLLSAGGFWGPRFGRGELVGALGLGARLGLARLSGMTPVGDDTSTVLRGWGGPAFMVHLQNGGSGWGLMLYAETGYALLAAVGNSYTGPLAAVQGIWITAGAGLSF